MLKVQGFCLVLLECYEDESFGFVYSLGFDYAQPAIYTLNAQPVIHIYSTSNICLTNYIED